MKKLVNRIQIIQAVRGCCAVGLVAALAGCDRNEVKVYQVPKEASAPAAPAAAAMPPMSGEVPAQPNLTWTLPEGWQEAPAGQMRLASFSATGEDGKKADVSIVPLGGVAGGDLSNLNRWRGQVGLAPVTAEELPKLGEKTEVAGAEATLFDIVGTNPAGEKSRILVTALQREGTSWFFKMTGEDALVEAQKPKFQAFLKSLKFDASAAAALPADHPPIGGNAPALPPDHPAMGSAMPGLATDNPAKPQWTVPAGWIEQAPTAMLLAKFSAGDATAPAEVTVSSFPGDVGGLPANINRWRRQLGLPPLDDAAANQTATSLDVAADKGSLVEMDGQDAKTGQPARLIGVAVPHEGQTWFFKMMGNEKSVAHEKDAFLKFVQTAKLSHAP